MLSSNKNNCAGFFVLLVTAFNCALATAQSAPGEDPINLQSRVSYQMLPLGGAPKSSSINFSTDIPAWQKARIARYEAKAFSGNKGDILTEKDVVNTATSDGFKTTCTQSIGSTAAPTGITTGAGVKPTQQVVVLRGDLVNICN
jgi:hypothetical protein